MNKKIINEKMVSILNWIEVSVTQTKDFVTEQTPLVVEELLLWNFTTSLVSFCVWFIIFAFVLLFSILSFKKAIELNWSFEISNKEDLSLCWGPRLMISLGLFFISITVFFAAEYNRFCLDWLQIKLAPRVWLIEYLNSEFLK